MVQKKVYACTPGQALKFLYRLDAQSDGIALRIAALSVEVVKQHWHAMKFLLV